MKNNIFIHKNHNLNKIYLKYFIALIPLIIYGIYKNGILLYLDHFIGFINIFKPLILPLLGALSGLLVHFVLKKEIKFNLMILYGVVIGMIMPISTNILVFTLALIGLLFLSNYLETKISFNVICMAKLILVLLLLLLNNYEYSNTVELTKEYAFSFIDIIFGRGIGGVCSSSLIWIVIGFSYLLTDYYYKKEIPIYALISYVVVTLIIGLIIQDFGIVLNSIFASSVWFAFVFIAPISQFSSYTLKGKIVFGILIGVISALLTLIIGSFESAILAILIASIFKDLIDNLVGQKITKSAIY